MAISTDTVLFLENYFDKILVVSIPRLTDRHQQVKQRLEDLPFDFFWGADKLQLDVDRMISDGIYDEQKARKLQRQGKSLNMGEIACSLSHRMVYEAIIKNGWERVLILEDDVVPLYDDLGKLHATMLELPPDWELVYLGYLKHEKVTFGLKIKQFFYKMMSSLGLLKWNYIMVCNLLPRPYSEHLKKAGFHDCTHAYAITLEAARKLLDAQTPVKYRADDLLSVTAMKGYLKAFITKPKFFDQEIFHNIASGSEIRA